MFEEDAEEIANKKLCAERICYNHCNFNSPKHHRCGDWHKYYEIAKECMEFGYNKANEWHYVKEGCKYPENGESVLVTVLDDDNKKIVTMALFEVENNKRFWDIESRLCSIHSGSEEVCSKIIAWARVLPAGGEK